MGGSDQNSKNLEARFGRILFAFLAFGGMSPILNALVKPFYERICRLLNENLISAEPLSIGPYRYSDWIVCTFLIDPSPLVGAIFYGVALVAFAALIRSKGRINSFYPLWFVFFVSGIFLFWQLSLFYFFFAAISLAFLSRIREYHFLRFPSP